VFAGAGDRDVRSFLGGVFGDDQVRGIGGDALRGERVLDVRESEVCAVGLVAVQRHLLAIIELHRDALMSGVDVGDVGMGAVAELSVLGMGDRPTDLDVVTGTELIRPARDRPRVLAELAGLRPDRLRAGVQFVEVLVRGLSDHDRRSPCGAVGVRGVEREVLGAGAIVGDVDAVAGGIATDSQLVLPGPEPGLVAPVGRVLGALVDRQLDVRAGIADGGVEV
jgi:hypothetical protein